MLLPSESLESTRAEPAAFRFLTAASAAPPADGRLSPGHHFCLHDASGARIDVLVEGSRNRLGSNWDRVGRALLAEDGAVLREVRHVRIPISIIGPPRLYPD